MAYYYISVTERCYSIANPPSVVAFVLHHRVCPVCYRPWSHVLCVPHPPVCPLGPGWPAPSNGGLRDQQLPVHQPHDRRGNGRGDTACLVWSGSSFGSSFACFSFTYLFTGKRISEILLPTEQSRLQVAGYIT